MMFAEPATNTAYKEALIKGAVEGVIVGGIQFLTLTPAAAYFGGDGSVALVVGGAAAGVAILSAIGRRIGIEALPSKP